MVRHLRLAAFLLAFIALAACGSDSSSGEAEAGGSESADLLDWSAPTVDGATLDAREYEGTPVALWFWAPWCPTCNSQAPSVADVAADPPPGVTILGIAGRDDVGPMRDFENEYALPFPSAVDASGDLWRRFGVRSQPSWVFLAADGTSTLVFGEISEDDLRQRLTELADDA